MEGKYIMITKEEILKKYGSNPNQKNTFINYDAIDALPDELEPVISEFTFDPQKLHEYFTNVGTEKKPSWYPQTDTMYKIAEMCGILGTTEKTVEWITEEVDINPILMKPFGSEPTMRIIKTGARVTKQSKVLCEDGNYRTCTPESNEFNFFNRASIEFLNEEKYTNSYTKKQEYYKYDTSIKRQLRLKELEKFAIQQAETKAFCKTIRVLAGLPTGFSTEDLKSGKLVFMKFIKSKRLQKLETAARIDAIRKGNTAQIEDMSDQLFGEKEIEPSVNPINEIITDNKHPENEITEIPPSQSPRHPKKNPFAESVIQKSEKEKIIDVLKEYATKQENVIKKTSGAYDFLNSAIIKSENATTEQLKDILLRIEKNIIGLKIIDHGIDTGKDIF